MRLKYNLYLYIYILKGFRKLVMLSKKSKIPLS